MSAPQLPCARCGHAVQLYCRGLCRPCYELAGREGNRGDFPPYLRPLTDTLAAIARHRSAGLKAEAIAQRLGYSSVSGVYTAMSRARARGLLTEETAR